MSWETKYIKIMEEISKGKIGNMEIHQNKETGEIYYMKKIDCEDKEKYNKTKQTLNQLKFIKHPNLAEIEDIFEDNKGSFYTYIKKADKNLYYMISEIKQDSEKLEDFLKQFIPQIINGYCRLMEENIIHRDLKPSNILCKKDNNQYIFKICDFGYSKIMNMNSDYDMTFAQEFCYYSAPELKQDNYSNKCDVYSFGLILAEFIFGKHFTDQEKEQLPKIKKNNQLQKIIDLLQQMIVSDPQDRISWTQLKLQYFYPNYDLIKENKFPKTQDINAKNGSYDNQLNEILINLKIKNNEEKNDNIIRILEVLNEKDYQSAYIIMEQSDGNLGQLRKTIGLFDTFQILNLIEQVNNGYQFLIKNRIVHRDIKPENILYVKIDGGYSYKIIDFQYSFDQTTKTQSASSKTGTCQYQAPEINGIESYDFQCDIYSLGIVILEMVTNISLLDETSIQNIQERLKQKSCIIDIIQGQPFNQNIQQIDQVTLDLLKQMIKYNPQERINWNQLTTKIKQIKQQSHSPTTTQQQTIPFQISQQTQFQNPQQFISGTNLTNQQISISINQFNSDPKCNQKNQDLPPYKYQTHQFEQKNLDIQFRKILTSTDNSNNPKSCLNPYNFNYNPQNQFLLPNQINLQNQNLQQQTQNQISNNQTPISQINIWKCSSKPSDYNIKNQQNDQRQQSQQSQQQQQPQQLQQSYFPQQFQLPQYAQDKQQQQCAVSIAKNQSQSLQLQCQQQPQQSQQPQQQPPQQTQQYIQQLQQPQQSQYKLNAQKQQFVSNAKNPQQPQESLLQKFPQQIQQQLQHSQQIQLTQQTSQSYQKWQPQLTLQQLQLPQQQKYQLEQQASYTQQQTQLTQQPSQQFQQQKPQLPSQSQQAQKSQQIQCWSWHINSNSKKRKEES